ncbi:hypothetical protein L218DRAFT_964961 [Marasmius fiardii PR-910]|nr:hypothetical protein L218DRAFT_964961 [Marasmius fiardii PR-910]
MDAFMERDSSPDPPSSPFTLTDVLPPPPPSPPSAFFALRTPASFDRRSDTSNSTTPSSTSSTRKLHENNTPAISPSQRPIASNLKYSTFINLTGQSAPYAHSPTIVSFDSEVPSVRAPQDTQSASTVMKVQPVSPESSKTKTTATNVRKTASDPIVAMGGVHVIRSPPKECARTDARKRQNGNNTTPQSRRSKVKINPHISRNQEEQTK